MKMRRFAGVLALLAVTVIVAEPAMAIQVGSYKRYRCYGVDKHGNASLKYGGNGTAKVLRLGDNIDGFDLYLLLARASVKNKKKIPQVYLGLPVKVPGGKGQGRGKSGKRRGRGNEGFTTNNSVVTVLGFVFTTYGYNITTAIASPGAPGNPI